jgi:hypothetical protein
MGYEDPHDGEEGLDRDLLRELTARALQPGSLFGRDLQLTEEYRAQLKLVVKKAREKIDPLKNDPAWDELIKLIQEGEEKGVLPVFGRNKDSYTPLWLKKGEADTQVKKIRFDSDSKMIAGIEVPDRIYWLYHWNRVIDDIEETSGHSDEFLRGMATSFLGESLRQVAQLFKGVEAKKQD